MISKAFTSTGYDSNNTIQLIRGGRMYFDLLEKLIDDAKESVHLQIYIYDDDETGKRITHALIRASIRGVLVYLLVDGYASRSLSPELIQSLTKAGVHFRWFEPLLKSRRFYIGRRMHHKVFVADGLHSLVGGLNISNRYNDMPEASAWLDWAVYVKGETSVGLYNRCRQMWSSWLKRIKQPIPFATLPKINNCFIRIRVNDWLRNRNQISRSYLEMFAHAQSDIIIMSGYFLPGRVFRKSMSLAAKRGVRIRIILTKISDIKLAKLVERFFYPWLLRRNIEIYEYREKILHGKMATYDSQWVTVGSYNFNKLSAYGSIELNLDVYDATFAHNAKMALENIIQKDCDSITSEVIQSTTNLWDVFVQRLAFELLRLIFFLFTFYVRQEK